MPRSFRFFVKKRGARSTTSRTLGGVAMGVFLALAFFIGSGFTLHYVTSLVIPEWRANNEFRPTTCTVVRFRLSEQHWLGSTNYRPEFLIVYHVDEQPFQAWTYDIAQLSSGDREAKEAVRDKFQIGGEYTCWYDPANPSTAVLVRGYSWSAWSVLLVPIALVVLGGGGLAYLLINWGKSLERRAALAQRTTALTTFEQNGYADQRFPFVPNYAQLAESPGTQLPVRLPIGTSPMWALLAALGVTIVANALAGLFVYLAARTHLDRQPDVWLTLLAIALLLAAIGTLVYLARKLMAIASLGSTILEISQHPLRLGGAYQVYLRQTGDLHVESLEIQLVCMEKATYQQGTNRRTEARRVHASTVYARRDMALKYGTPLEVRCQHAVPETAMHSFKSDHNEVAWQLVVKADAGSGRGFERAFPLVVCPPGEEQAEP